MNYEEALREVPLSELFRKWFKKLKSKFYRKLFLWLKNKDEVSDLIQSVDIKEYYSGNREYRSLRVVNYGIPTDETWYCEEYMKEQIRITFKAGMHRGAKIDIRYIDIFPDSDDERRTQHRLNEFKKIIDQEFEKEYMSGQIFGANGKPINRQ